MKASNVNECRDISILHEGDIRVVLPVLPPDEVFIEVFIEIPCKSEFNTCVFEILTLHVMYLIKFFVTKFQS